MLHFIKDGLEDWIRLICKLYNYSLSLQNPTRGKTAKKFPKKIFLFEKGPYNLASCWKHFHVRVSYYFNSTYKYQFRLPNNFLLTYLFHSVNKTANFRDSQNVFSLECKKYQNSLIFWENVRITSMIYMIKMLHCYLPFKKFL